MITLPSSKLRYDHDYNCCVGLRDLLAPHKLSRPPLSFQLIEWLLYVFSRHNSHGAIVSILNLRLVLSFSLKHAHTRTGKLFFFSLTPINMYKTATRHFGSRAHGHLRVYLNLRHNEFKLVLYCIHLCSCSP